VLVGKPVRVARPLSDDLMDRATIRQKKTGRPVRFELTDETDKPSTTAFAWRGASRVYDIEPLPRAAALLHLNCDAPAPLIVANLAGIVSMKI